ncbi:HTH-type transcriptional regulator BetI [uncultured archaeon]|nr:HTH-type transcriptional regulator BetI [uncultured archaeon]
MKRIVKDPVERRKELIDTAERMFITNGYDQTAVSDIVKEVNLSQGAFYYYFESKEDILVAILEKNVAVMEIALRETAERTDLDEAVKLNAMFNQLISATVSGKKIHNYIHQEMNAVLHKKLIKIRFSGRIAQIIAEVISKGTEKGRFNVSRPLETSYILVMLFASAFRVFNLSETSDEMKDTEQASNQYRENVRISLEDLLGRALGVSDYRFFLPI